MIRIDSVLRGLVAAAVVAALAGGAWLWGAGSAHAQPNPPAVYTGSVTINGNPAPPGTGIVAYIGNTVCGSTVVSTVGQYVLQCAGGNVGDPVTFTVNGLPAGSATWDNRRLNQVDLVAEEGTPTPTPTATPTRTPTPRPPSTGSGAVDGGASGGTLALALLGLAVLGAGAAGTVLVRRAR